ncbi:MAG: hypothetical protein R2764_11640 [Bacteroidales bacterium]
MLGIITATFTSCYYDNAEELYPQPVECDTINVTYSQTIAPIMNTNCNDCHSGAAPPANVITDNYTGLKTIADDGRLWGSINHESGYSPMPKDRPKMNDCDLKKINIWLDNGALND